ncbi:MAG: alpha/beta fold hydrolase [Woeseiaceae bacterium]
MRTMPILLSLLLSVGASAQDLATDAVEAEIDVYARDTYRTESLICPFKGRIEYDPGEIECGLLQVPENRENPESRFIELHFVKLNSTWDDEEEDEKDDDEEDAGLEPGKRDDPVIYLSGGPGAVAEGYVERFYDHRLRKHRDLYILEQRGIANSGDFCTNYFTRKPENFNVDSLEKQAEASLGAARDCATNAIEAGVDVTAYNTIENARDVKALRKALGFETWNVWGISYGSILGQAYLKEDPQGIRAAVIDAIVPLDARGEINSWRVMQWYDRDLKKLDELCQADDNCAESFPDLGGRVRDGARALMGNPIAVDVKDTELYPSGEAYILSDIATFLPFIFFYEQSNYPALPAIIYAWTDALERRDETLFKAIAIAPAGFGTISQGMYDAIMCNDGDVDAMIDSAAADREAFPILSKAFGLESTARLRRQNCIDLGMTARARAEYAPVQTGVPTLLIEGDMDPITPPPLAHAIAPGFSNATYVEFPYAGHGPSRSVECAGDMLNKFYDDPTAEPDLSCVDEMEPPEFLGSLYHSSFVPKFIALAVEDKKKLPGVASWGGVSVLIVLIAFLVLTFAPLVRRLDKRQPVPAGRARIATWAAAFLGTMSLGIFGAAAAVSFELSEFLLIFGMVPWAALGAWSGVLGGVFGIVAIGLTIRARLQNSLPMGTLTGFVLTGIAAVSLSAFFLTWGLGP